MNPSLQTTPSLDPRSRATAHPLCPHFGPCGGCQLQSISYPDQLTAKTDRLHTLLQLPADSAVFDRPGPSPPYGYRNRIRLTLTHLHGELRAGYIGRASSQNPGPGLADAESEPSRAPSPCDILPITQCPIAAPILWRATEALLELSRTDPQAAPWLRAADQIELFTTADEARLQITLFLRRPARQERLPQLDGLFAATMPPRVTASFHTFCEAARARIPQLHGAGVTLLPPASPRRSRRAEPASPGPTWGTPGTIYPVTPTAPGNSQPPAPIAYWIPRGAFFQINRFLLPQLLTLITHATGGQPRTGALAWDLYAGIGFFSRALARSFQQVVAVEIAEPAAAALASTKLPNLRAIKATTLDFLKAAVVQRERPDLIVLDPPRTGLGSEICALLARIAAPTLAYVSCNPEALAQDLASLTASGYETAHLHLLDLFPQTSHIETVAILHHS